MSVIESMIENLAGLPGVVAVSIGGSRAQGREQPDSDWDLGVYYRGGFDTAGLRRLGYEGTIVEPGEWGSLMNGGAWLTVEGLRVDVLYRDLDVVEHWVAEAGAGRFEVHAMLGYLAGMATYQLAGELALSDVRAGELPRPAYPPALAVSAPPNWRYRAQFSLRYAETYARRGEVAGCAGSLARAATEEAHARLAERRQWVLNEKGIFSLAGLEAADRLLEGFPADPPILEAVVAEASSLLG
jgi:hypothetical protein